MMGIADCLQVAFVVCAVLGLGRDVVNLGCRGHAPFALAWLAQVAVALEDALAQLNPGCAITSLMP